MLIGVLGTVAAALLLLLVALWRWQERLVFQPPREHAPLPHRDVVARLEGHGHDGQALLALVVRARPEIERARERPLVLAFHGNADLAVWRLPWAEELRSRAGVTVVLAEYRGYGGLPGEPSVAGVRRDAAAIAGALRTSAASSAAKIILYGHSLGSAVATELAAELGPACVDALILEAPFTSARDMARVVAPSLSWLWRSISRVPYDTADLVARLDLPVWVTHGERDWVVPLRMGRAVHRAARRPGALLVVPQAGHNDVAEVGGESYWSWLMAAVRPTPAMPLETRGETPTPDTAST
ncbi:MAG TPA: alpha/beta fold hydrolase [Gemmatimonadaceae bacterium]|nr:alpha/beta fold hydrolase [Gemmatimonadaceae bacterium]